MTLKSSICARYKAVDGWHVFQSDELPGLYVASKDAQAAYNDVGPCIELLLKLDEGIHCTVVPEVPFRDFLRAVSSAEDVDAGAPLVMSDRRFCLSGATA